MSKLISNYRAISALELREAVGKLKVKPAAIPVYDGLTKSTGSVKKGTFQAGHPKVVGSYQPATYQDDDFRGGLRRKPEHSKPVNGNCRTASTELRVRLQKHSEKDSVTGASTAQVLSRREIAACRADVRQQSRVVTTLDDRLEEHLRKLLA